MLRKPPSKKKSDFRSRYVCVFVSVLMAKTTIGKSMCVFVCNPCVCFVQSVCVFVCNPCVCVCGRFFTVNYVGFGASLKPPTLEWPGRPRITYFYLYLVTFQMFIWGYQFRCRGWCVRFVRVLRGKTRFGLNAGQEKSLFGYTPTHPNTKRSIYN